MSEGLKPCPFCGGEDIAIGKLEILCIKYFIWCKTCEACSSSFLSLDDAINAWNRRAKENA